MKQTLIKLNEQHYIVVDDSEIKEPFDGYCLDDEGNIRHGRSDLHTLSLSKKITHSTQPLNKDFNDWFDAKIISLSEVEEAIYGYSIDELFLKWESENGNCYNNEDSAFEAGFKAHQELVKDKLFTIEDMKKSFNAGYDLNTWEQLNIPNDEREYLNEHDYIQSLLPKTEWECCISDGKLVLL